MAILFSYQAKNRFGQLQTGAVEAADPAAVARYLRERGFVATRIEPHPSANRADSQSSWLLRYQRVSLRDLAVFCRQFATLTSAGISMTLLFNIAAAAMLLPLSRGMLVALIANEFARVKQLMLARRRQAQQA